MTPRPRLAALALAIAIAVPARAADPPSPPVTAPAPADGATITLEPGTAVAIACDTRAVVVADGAPAATRGTIRLALERTAAAAAAGRWTPASADPGHTGSFAARERAACASGCPLTLAPNGEIQLWAPAAKSLDTVKEGETLLLAIIRADRALRASTFRGQSIEALEEGPCRKVTP